MSEIRNPNDKPAYNLDSREREEAFREEARALVAQMTLSEKVSQTVNHAAAIPRLDIPSYDWWNEALHGVARAGVATVFPQAISLAATFDTELLGEVADAIAVEGRAKFNAQQAYGDTDIYKGLTFWSPNINIFRDPRWGRGHETYGEDPYLTARLGVSFIEHLQGNGEAILKALACAKHFAVHSGPEGKRHSFDAIASQKDMAETYLPAFEAAVKEAGVEAVMGAYNRTNGEPCCGSETLLTKILRDAWGFEGHVVSDCWAIKDFHEHHRVTNSALESVAMAINNGTDLNCGNLFHLLGEAVQSGMVSEERLDEAVTTLIVARMKLGIIGDTEENELDRIPYAAVDSPEHQALNRKVARNSVVLLKNEAFLPLERKEGLTIGVIGPNANSRQALVGNYEGTASRYYTVLEGIQDLAGDGIRVLTSEGCHLYKKGISGLSEGSDRLSEAYTVACESDVIVAVMGLDATIEGEEGDASNEFGSGDKDDLNLPGEQQRLLDLLKASGKPVILVLLSGSALAVSAEADSDAVPAIIWGGYPGSYGGRAIAEIIFGDVSPSAKLPVTFYRTTDELPDFEDYNMAGRTYRYMETDALYPFGYGLTYANFKLEAELSDTKLPTADERISIRVTLTNSSQIASRETVQVYVQSHVEGMPHWNLRAFTVVEAEGGESKTVQLYLDESDFHLFDENGEAYLSDQAYTVHVGRTQPDRRSQELVGEAPLRFTIERK